METEVKSEVRDAEEVKEGAKMDDKSRSEGHRHKLMNIKLNLMEISHRVVERVERERYKILRNPDLSEEEAIEKFKEYVWEQLTDVE